MHSVIESKAKAKLKQNKPASKQKVSKQASKQASNHNHNPNLNPNASFFSGQAAATTHGEARTGGSTFVCLPDQPWYFGQVDLNTQFKQNNTGASERRTQFHQSNSPLRGTQFYMTCVVCLVKSRSVQVMLPARKECNRGWNREYSGFLVVSTNRKNHQDIICIDRDARSLLSNAQYVRGLYADCDSLSCPPYASDERLACVVCSM